MDAKDVRNLKALLLHVKDKNNPKYELNGVLVYGNKLVCTDTKQMLVLEFTEAFTAENLEEPVLLCVYKKDIRGSLASRPDDMVSMLDKNCSVLDDLGLKIVKHTGVYSDFNKAMGGIDSPKAKTKTLAFEDKDEVFADAICLNGSIFDSRLFYKFLEIAYRLNPSEITLKQEWTNAPLLITGHFSLTDYGETPPIKFSYACMPVFRDVAKDEEPMAEAA